jgi:hypothetical protein
MSPASLHMGIIDVEDRFWDDGWQLVYVHEESPQVLPTDRRHVDDVPVIRVYPQVSRVHSLEAVTAEWTRLRS